MIHVNNPIWTQVALLQATSIKIRIAAVLEILFFAQMSPAALSMRVECIQ